MQAWPFDVVLLVRHGQTEWNLSGRRQGQLDSPLTELGTEQGRQVAAALVGRDVDAVFASPLGRAVATAARCARRLRLPVTIVDELAEVHHGEMAGLTSAEIDRRFPGALERRAASKYSWRFPGGESYADADLRAGAALRVVASSGARRPLLVSHEMVGRVLLRNLLAARPETALGWTHPHDVIYEVDVRTRESCAIQVRPDR